MGGAAEAAAAATSSQAGQGWGWRHVQVLFLTLGACSGITMRVCLSVAVVDMTDRDNGDGQQRFEWSPAEKSAVLGSFLWGYMTTQVLGGALSVRGRATLLMLCGLTMSGVLTAVLPFVASAGGASAVTALRVATGVIQGALFPTCLTLLGRWAPPAERSRAGALLLGAQPIGNVIAMGMSGWLAAQWGWPSVFFVFGASAVVVAVALYLVCSDSPHSHPRISQAERDYIVKSLSENAAPAVRLPVPWLAMLTSRALLTTVFAHCGYLWGYWVIVACVPSYLNNLLHVGIEWNGLLSAAPHVSMGLGCLVFGWLGDFIEKRRLMSISRNRKLLNTIGECGPGAMCVLIALLGPAHHRLAVGLLVVAGFLLSATFSGCPIAFVDMAPNFSGINFALSNMVGAFVSAFAPYSEGVFVDRNDPMPGWSNVFYLTAGVYFVLNLMWCVFGTAEVQPWNYPGGVAPSPASSSTTTEVIEQVVVVKSIQDGDADGLVELSINKLSSVAEDNRITATTNGFVKERRD